MKQSKWQKIREAILSGKSAANISWEAFGGPGSGSDDPHDGPRGDIADISAGVSKGFLVEVVSPPSDPNERLDGGWGDNE